MNATTAKFTRPVVNSNNAVANPTNNSAMNNSVVNNSVVNQNSMENVFNTLQEYGSNWEILEVRNFNAQELTSIEKVEVRASTYGKSMCFFMKNGKKTFIPVDRESNLNIGDEVAADKVQLRKLVNVSDPNKAVGEVILRVDVEPEEEVEPTFDNPLGI